MALVITPLQIIIILFALFALSRAVLRFKDGQITKGELSFWSLLWITLIIVTFVPKVIGFISRLLGIGRPVDAVIYAAIIVLFYLVFRIYVKLESIDQDITAVVRKVTLRKKK